MELNKYHYFKTKVEYLGQTITPHELIKTEAHTKRFEYGKHSRARTELRSFAGM